jgi:hypothetical protein
MKHTRPQTSAIVRLMQMNDSIRECCLRAVVEFVGGAQLSSDQVSAVAAYVWSLSQGTAAQ